MPNKFHFLSIPLDDEPRETDAAYGIFVNNQKIWIPKSQVSDWTISENVLTFWIPEWLMENKGLEIFVDTGREPTLF